MKNYKIKAVEQEFIPDFPPDKDYDTYYKRVLNDFQIVKKFFPLLHMVCLPTRKPKEIFFTGNLIPSSLLQKCVSQRDIERNSLYILGIHPNEYPEENIFVEDLYEKIDWESNIPKEHLHLNLHPKTNRIVLCTHHPYGEINALKQTDKTVAILFSAWKLYMQYKKYLKTQKWTLKDLRHGDEGTLQLIELEEYYEIYKRHK